MRHQTAGSTEPRRRRPWGERQAFAAVALVTAAVVGALTVGDPAVPATATLVAVAVCAVVPVAADGLVGLLVGLLSAAALVVVRQWTGAWTPESFGRSLATTVLLLLLGWAVGRLGKRLRGSSRPEPSLAQAAAFGSMGLVTEVVAEARLEEEALRAQRHRRVLSVMLVRTSVVDGSADRADAAQRVAARHVEAALRRTDVPFALAPDLVGAILPETPAEGAWQVAGSLLERVADTTFTDRDERSRQRLGDHATVAVGIATLPDDGADARTLLAAALRSLGGDEQEPARAPHGESVR
ncbi:hypothetical protein [Aquipuribacter nitratireducens]|uniref:GGDEF domain-containing protein n=1 Tax=Aquipuribacter nitratireducens TaxID=650104 RepID=A0ABW0GMI3_9MICO